MLLRKASAIIVATVMLSLFGACSRPTPTALERQSGVKKMAHIVQTYRAEQDDDSQRDTILQNVTAQENDWIILHFVHAYDLGFDPAPFAPDPVSWNGVNLSLITSNAISSDYSSREYSYVLRAPVDGTADIVVSSYEGFTYPTYRVASVIVVRDVTSSLRTQSGEQLLTDSLNVGLFPDQDPVGVHPETFTVTMIVGDPLDVPASPDLSWLTPMTILDTLSAGTNRIKMIVGYNNYTTGYTDASWQYDQAAYASIVFISFTPLNVITSVTGTTTYTYGIGPTGINREDIGGQPLPEVMHKRWLGDTRYYPPDLFF